MMPVPTSVEALPESVMAMIGQTLEDVSYTLTSTTLTMVNQELGLTNTGASFCVPLLLFLAQWPPFGLAVCMKNTFDIFIKKEWI